VELDDLQTNKVSIDDVNIILAPNFSSTFDALLKVKAIEERKKQAKLEKETRSTQSQTTMSSSGSQTRKRPPQSPRASESSKRTRTEDTSRSQTSVGPKTPDKPTFAVDPKFSHSTVESGASMQSKDEENTKSLANTFLADVMAVLGPAFREIRWQQSGVPVQLVTSYPISPPNC